jgi:protein-tyrosine phosphatase
MLRRQGARTVVATPHFYRRDESISSFLARRDRAFSELSSELGFNPALVAADAAYPAPPRVSIIPRVLLGAEVAFFAGMSAEPDIRRLCVEGSDLLLLEMPFAAWSSPVINEVRGLGARGIRPVIAHIERYLDDSVNRARLDELIALGAVIQSNASFFTARRSRRKALNMLDNGLIHVFGSDCHNLSRRPPDLDALLRFLRKKFSRDFLAALDSFADEILAHASVRA